MSLQPNLPNPSLQPLSQPERETRLPASRHGEIVKLSRSSAKEFNAPYCCIEERVDLPIRPGILPSIVENKTTKYRDDYGAERRAGKEKE